MKRDFLKELELSDEQIEAVFKEHGKAVNEYKTKAEQVDTLQSQIDDYKQQLTDRDKQLKDLEGKASGNEDLQQQIKDLQKANNDAQKEYENKLNEQMKESKLELLLKDSKARNPKAVKALLDSEVIKLKDGELDGVKHQLDALKESDAYLFESDEPKLKGREPHSSDPNKQQGLTKEQFNKMGYSERAQLFQDDPDTYKQLTN